jgi:hypothetical protein
MPETVRKRGEDEAESEGGCPRGDRVQLRFDGWQM